MGRLDPIPFWYLRHGETDWNARNLSQGNVDLPLNATGEAQARDVAAALRDRGVTRIVSSPLGRARATAAACSEALGLPVEVDPGLREAAFGVQEGQPMSAWFASWIAGDFTPEGAESFAALRLRAVTAIDALLAGSTGLMLVVGHGAFFRALRAEMGFDPGARLPNAIPVACLPPSQESEIWRLDLVPLALS